MKRTILSVGGLGVTMLVAACASGVQIQTQSTVDASAAASAANAASDERDLAGRSTQRRSVSVLPFDVSTTDSTFGPLGYGFAELLLTDLAVSHQLVIVDRLRVDDVRRERSLSSQGATDRATALRLGRMVAAQDIVLGALTVPADNSLRFETNIADVQTGRVAAALSGQGGIDQVFDAERQLVMKLFDQMGVKLTPAELSTLDQSPRTSTKAFVAYSSGVRAESRGDLVVAQAEYERAIIIDPKFIPAAQHRAALLGRVAKQAAAVAPVIGPVRLDASPDAVVARTVTTQSAPAAAPAIAPAASSSAPASAPVLSRSSSTVTRSSASATTVPAAGAVNVPPSTPAKAMSPAQIRRDSINRARHDSITRVRRDSIAAVVRVRQDSIARRRAARHDSVVAAIARHKADSIRAKRGAKAPVKGDSANVADKDSVAARKPPAHKEPPPKPTPTVRRPPLA